MKKEKTRVATILFLLGILIAGIANAFSKQLMKTYVADVSAPAITPFFSTALFCVNLFLYLFLLVFWIHSVQRRLLRDRARNYLISAACCAVAMLVLRSIKYRLIDEWALDAARYLWYLYYLPMILLPTLFLMTCVRIESRHRTGRFDERLLLIPAVVLISLFLTNDLHYLAFSPNGDTVMTGANASYFNNVLFYVYYAYYGVTIIAGLILLMRANRRHHSFKKTVLPFAFLLIMLGFALIDKTLNWVRLPSMFAVPEIVSFGMIGLFESCVRNRLIPYNENYMGFFELMCFPAVITDSDLTVVMQSSEPVNATAEQLRSAMTGSVYTDPDTKLSGKPITAGCVFYTEDESELHRVNDRLIDANELIDSENELIQAENDLKTRQAQVDSRNRIYARIDEKMLPYHRRAMQMLDEMRTDAPDFKEKAARLNLLNVYIKRGTNLLLTGEGENEIPLWELRLAFEELVRYLSDCGVQANVTVDGEGTVSRTDALQIFTVLYEVTESLLSSVNMLHIALNGTQLRVIADCGQPPKLPRGVSVQESDELYFFSFPAGEGGTP